MDVGVRSTAGTLPARRTRLNPAEGAKSQTGVDAERIQVIPIKLMSNLFCDCSFVLDQAALLSETGERCRHRSAGSLRGALTASEPSLNLFASLPAAS